MEKPAMNLYLLQRTNQFGGCDETIRLVVRATSEMNARSMAADVAGDEGGSPWLSGFEFKYGIRYAVTCELLTADGEPGIVCRDYY